MQDEIGFCKMEGQKIEKLQIREVVTSKEIIYFNLQSLINSIVFEKTVKPKGKKNEKNWVKLVINYE